MKRALLILLLSFVMELVSAQPGVGKTKDEIENYAKQNGWVITEPYHLEAKTTYSERFKYSGKDAFYCFDKVGDKVKCVILILSFSSESEYYLAKKNLNITPTTEPMYIPTLPPNVKTFGVTIKGVDFYRGFDDKNKIVVRGVGRRDY